jgi:hypothetical protein
MMVAMNRSAALQMLRGARPALESRGIAHAAIFGSVARNDPTDRSDVDVLIEVAKGKRLDLISLGGVQTILERVFGTNVDIVLSPVKNAQLLIAIQRDRVDAF